jgi:hypothetical protein
MAAQSSNGGGVKGWLAEQGAWGLAVMVSFSVKWLNRKTRVTNHLTKHGGVQPA